MRRLRRDCRRDANAVELIGYLRDLGWQVWDTAQVGPNFIAGFPDALGILCSCAVALEIKAPGGQLSQAEREFRALWQGPYEVIASMDDAVTVTRKYMA